MVHARVEQRRIDADFTNTIDDDRATVFFLLNYSAA